ncbi:hypothetical protein ACIP4X_30325 [Streptomyces sp. NPDC088817]|uniref:hypothetical protein n=1 Tax=unclassified Streptomyces TaxID=2593676 RepID=UPI0036E31CA2
MQPVAVGGQSVFCGPAAERAQSGRHLGLAPGQMGSRVAHGVVPGGHLFLGSVPVTPTGVEFPVIRSGRAVGVQSGAASAEAAQLFVERGEGGIHLADALGQFTDPALPGPPPCEGADVSRFRLAPGPGGDRETPGTVGGDGRGVTDGQ